MKKSLLAVFAVIALIHSSAFASNATIAPVLSDLDVTEVGTQGSVLETYGPYAGEGTITYLIGIPAKVSTGSVCVSFVGQETEIKNNKTKIIAKGASSAVSQPCIEIFPMPIDTTLTFKLNVSTSLPVAQASQPVVIGDAAYQVILDLHTQKVEVRR